MPVGLLYGILRGVGRNGSAVGNNEDTRKIICPKSLFFRMAWLTVALTGAIVTATNRQGELAQAIESGDCPN